MNLVTKQKQIHSHGKQTYGYQWRKGEEDKLGVGINRYTLLYVNQINKDLLYSTQAYIQYLTVTYNGKGSGKYIYI